MHSQCPIVASACRALLNSNYWYNSHTQPLCVSQAWVDSLAEAEHLFSLLETEGGKGNIKSLFGLLQTASGSVQKRKEYFLLHGCKNCNTAPYFDS